MHKGIILLVRAEDRVKAEDKVNEFLESYEGSVWDWYSIGNRWSNLFAPKEKAEEHKKWVKETYKEAFSDLGYSVNELEEEPTRTEIQNKWKELGLLGKNPYYSGYGFAVNDDEPYNIVPLSEALPIVKDWVKDLDKEKEELWNKMLEAKKEADEGKYDMTGYYSGQYKDAQYGNFCGETNVYNVEDNIAENIPENIDGFWAVIVDIHN